MAFDGTTVACLTAEFRQFLTNARIFKIAQTEKDELILTCKTASDEGRGRTLRLLMSAQAQLPIIALIDDNKPSPVSAPAFCMLLRKYLENGRIVSVEQPSLERVVRFNVTHYDEMGDLKNYVLLIELMGKHSNIILIDEEDTILDAIKRVPASVSSVREVLPGRTYFLPDTMHKRDPYDVADVVTLTDVLKGTGEDIHGALIKRFTGISPVIATELCARACVDPSASPEQLSYEEKNALTATLSQMMSDVREGRFAPCIYYEEKKAVEYAAFPLHSLETRGCRAESYDEMSRLLSVFYAQKQVQSRIRNKSADLRSQVSTLLARTVRKYDQQLQQMKDTEKRDKYRLRGELLTAYAHEVPAGAKEVRLTDYNTGKEVTVPLDETLSATENAQKCFDRYQRMKRTHETLSVLTKDVKEEIDHLKSIRMALDLATEETELAEIRRELIESGYLKEKRTDRTAGGKKGGKGGAGGKSGRSGGQKGAAGTKKSAPMHYVTSDGFDVYVGKNNAQNDELTFHSQGKDDWWFHAKGIPGSHVVLKGKGTEIPDRAFEEAAALAAYYSAGRENGKVEIDYVERKQVKKPAKAKPGFVIYYTNYSMVVSADISALTQVDSP